MKEDESVSKYSNRISFIVKQIYLLGENFSYSKIVEKVIVTFLERFESKISSLKESKDLNNISMVELIGGLQAQEQRRVLRQEKNY